MQQESSTQSDDDAGTTCTVCFDQWTIGTDHRICALKCGHLYGRSCIERWIKDQGTSAKCPNCNKPARKADIRDLWCKTIKASDSTELNELKSLLENEKKLRKDVASQVYHYKLKLQVAYEDIDRLKSAVIERDRKIQRFEEIIVKQSGNHVDVTTTDDTRDSISVDYSTADETPQIATKGLFHEISVLVSCPNGGCRSLALSHTMGLAVFTQPSPVNMSALGQYGIKKYSIIDTQAHQFIPLHAKPINGFQLNQSNDMALTASADKKIKITSLLNNTTVLRYEVNQEPWCVAWNTERIQQFYVGLRNYVRLYDMRNTSEHVYQTPPLANGRLLSMAFYDSDFKGLLLSDNQGSQFLEVTDSSNYSDNFIDTSQNILPSHMLPFSGRMGTVDYCKKSNYALISTRPSPPSPQCVENLVTLEKVMENESNIPQIEVKPVRTFNGSRDSLYLSQSRILRHPTVDHKVLVASSDEVYKGLRLYDSFDGSCFQSIPSKSTVRDTALLSNEDDTHFLFCLNDKGLSIHRWDLV